MNTWKISKNGSTYRFLQRWNRGVPANTSFCEYYKMLAFNILKVFTFSLSIPGLFTMALIFMGYIKATPFTPEFWFYITMSLFGMVALCFVLAWFIVGIIWLIAVGGSYILPYIQKGLANVLAVGLWAMVNSWYFITKPFHKTENKDKPSFIRTWYQSKKEKFCPIVEFTEE